MNVDILLLIPIFVPIAVGILIFFIPTRVKWVKEILSLIASAVAFAAALRIFFVPGLELKVPLIEVGEFYLNFDLVTSPLNSFILIFSTGFGFLIVLYSLRYMAGRHRLNEYYAFLLLTIGGSSAVLLANHLLMLLIFWEVVTASLYFLVTTGDPEAREGATKSFVMIGASDGSMLMGIGILWYLSQSFTISSINVPIAGWLPTIGFILMMVGATTKAGSMPFHTWIPSASEGAPASVMALLPAALDKLLGIYLLVRITTSLFTMNYPMSLLLMIIGAVTIVAAVMIAMVQHDLRRLLSYHAISQVGYMVLGVGTMTPVGIAGGVFHMLNNAIFKNCLFLCGGAVEHKARTTELGELGGLARAMPVTFITCLIAALSISGVPPFNGFVSKWMIYQGTIDTGSGSALIFLVAAAFGSALTLASFIKVIYSIFLGRRSERTAVVEKDVGFSMQLPVIVLALLCVIFGVFYRFPLENFIYPGTSQAIELGGIWSATLATGLMVLGLAVGLVIYLIGNVRRFTRVADTFIGGEKVGSEVIRVPGTHFYDTIRSIAPLGKVYERQERGDYDPYVQLGRIGSGITEFLRRLHSGLLPMYLSWSLLGIVVLLFLLAFLK
ncbi:MAG: NADH-quinone oxidoreductase subunit 5 family protein [bacterium]